MMVPGSMRHSYQLPSPHSSFIGRERAIEEISNLISSPSTRLVTLTGAGGSGKTRLAVAVAYRLADVEVFAHGLCFIPLARVETPSLVPQTIMVALGLTEAGDRSYLSILQNYLLDKTLLLILDNCEHLSTSCSDLAHGLLADCPHLRILTTSREPLGLAEEKVWLVPPLSVPDTGPLRTVDQLAKMEAIQLFVERAGEALPEFRLSKENSPAVAQICRRLEGIPLAIELAAARLRMLDIEQIAARLDHILQLLSHGSRETPPRHQTMRAALDWSHDLLSGREQSLFCRLAVFAGSFTLDAVEQICTSARRTINPVTDKDELHTSEALDLLTDLVDKSMILIAERQPGVPVRYRMLEPIRQYALEKLRIAKLEAEIRTRHLNFYLVFGEVAEPNLKGENQLFWLDQLDREYDNLRAALNWSTMEASRCIAGLRLAVALHQFWHQRGYWSEGRQWLSQAISNYDAHRDDAPAGAELALARAIVAEGWLAYTQGDYGNTLENLARGVELARTHQDWATVAVALALQAQLTSYAGHPDEALRISALGVVEARRAEDSWTVAWVAYVHGMILYRRDETAARIILDESLELFRQVGDHRSVAAVLNTFGYMSANAGEVGAARSQFEEALSIGNELGDKNIQMIEVINLAHLARLQGDLERAVELYQAVLEESRDLGRKHTISGILEGLGHVCILQGDLDTAYRLLLESMQICHEIGFQSGTAQALSGLARIVATWGRVIQAARILGAVNSFLSRRGTRIDADAQSALDQDLNSVRSVLQPAEFEAAYAFGQTLTLEQAIEELSSLDRMQRGMALSPGLAGETLTLNGLGSMQVTRGGRVLTAWPYAKVRELLFYLASYPARTKAQIGMALWPEASPAQLRSSLGTTLYHLRHAVDNPKRILFEEELYHFNRDIPYHFDVEEFEACLIQAKILKEQTPGRAIVLLQEADRLYHGDFLEDYLEGEWHLHRREELRRKYLETLLELGALLFSQAHFDQAAETYRRAIEKEDVLEAAHRELMRCYARLGERGRALRQYQTLQDIMQAEFGSSPAPESTALYEQLKRGEEA